MKRHVWISIALCAVSASAFAQDLRVSSDRTVGGFAFPESVAYDPKAKVLYVSDNRNDKLVKIEPADFLDAKKAPGVTEVFSGAGVNPNGLYPQRDGMLLMVGFLSPKQARGIFALGVSGQLKTLSDPLGRLDGVYELSDGTLLVTDWGTGSLFRWNLDSGRMQILATGFKGPADFAVVPGARGAMTVVVPDLVQSQLRFVRLRPK